MQPRLSTVGKLTLAGIVSLALAPGLALGDDGHTYQVTITNLTAGQPLTPPVLVTHNRRTGIFTLGEAASPAIQAIAENGNNTPLLTALAGDVHVHEVVEGTAPLVPANDPGSTALSSTATFLIRADNRARFLSFASMLICTNDGFTGLDTVSLPLATKTVYSVAHDARTEANTEDFVDMVPPCQGLIGVTSDDMGTGDSNPLLAEDGIIIPHAGIVGGRDLVPAIHNWSDPVAKIVITRLRGHEHD